MTKEPTQKRRSIFADLSIPQVLAGALSAITVALVLTRLGFSGTLIGAGIGSVMGALGTTAYSQSLNKSAELVKKKIPRPVEGRMNKVQPLAQSQGASGNTTVVLPTSVLERETADTAEESANLPSYAPQVAPTPEESENENKKPVPSWKSIALLAVVSLTVALAFLSFFEVRMLSENRADGVVIQRVIAPSETPEKEVIVEREVVIVETPAPQDDNATTNTESSDSSGEQEEEQETQQEQDNPTQEENGVDSEKAPVQEQPTQAPVEPEDPAAPETPVQNPAPVVPPADETGTDDKPAPPPEPSNPGSGTSEDDIKVNNGQSAGVISAQRGTN